MENVPPFKLIEIPEGDDVSYSLFTSEFDPYEEAFVECGYEGGGYDWEALARQVIRARAPQLSDRVQFDPEASMFTAYGPDREALVELAGQMQQVLADKEALVESIKAADPDWFD